jgi:hypothetical protein
MSAIRSLSSAKRTLRGPYQISIFRVSICGSPAQRPVAANKETTTGPSAGAVDAYAPRYTDRAQAAIEFENKKPGITEVLRPASCPGAIDGRQGSEIENLK